MEKYPNNKQLAHERIEDEIKIDQMNIQRDEELRQRIKV